jgi:hypothetical protein
VVNTGEIPEKQEKLLKKRIKKDQIRELKPCSGLLLPIIKD